MKRQTRNPIADRGTLELDEINAKYQKAEHGSRNKDQLRVEWYEKIKKIAATIRQD